MSRVLKQTDKTIEELRQNRLVVAPECSVIENAETDTEQRVYCQNAFMFRNRMRCQSYAFPKAKWRNGQNCPRATHIQTETETKTATGKIRVGQQKQKKKSRR